MFVETWGNPALGALLDRSRSVRAESARLMARYAEIREHIGQERRRALTQTTAVIDTETVGHPVMVARVDRLSAQIGRSADIERAKALLARRYGITRGEAFAILRSISSHSNRKLRDVAVELVDGAADGERATLKRSG
jgi:AmiR/NasT family two-component response regulator